MKILMANNYYYLRGGCERVMFNDMEALSSQGMDVVPFSAADPANVPSNYSKYFPLGADIRAKDTLHRIKAAADAIHCDRSAVAFAKALDDIQPDVIHFHNIYGRLSTSVLGVARQRGIPAVLTTHDYKVVCPSYLMLKNGKPCTSCLDGGYYRCAIHRCHKNDLAASLVYSAEAYYARMTDHYGAISAFLCPSQFIADLLIRSGITANRVIYHPNCVEPSAYACSLGGSYALYAGRLSHEKGLGSLLKAVSGTNIPLRIAGAGPMEGAVREMAASEGSSIHLEGHCEGARLADLYRNAAFVVVPSEWFENAPMSVLEAFAYGKPVVATRIGGLPELVTAGENGLLVEAGAPDQLRAAMVELWNSPSAQQRMGRRARNLVETKFSQNARTSSLLEIYRNLSCKGSREARTEPQLVGSTAY